MLTGLANELLTLTADIIEGVMLALIGVKPAKRKRYTRRATTTYKRQRNSTRRDRNWSRLSGKLFAELPRDVAISVLNDVKRYGMEV